MSCGIGHSLDSDPTLLWLWCRPVDTVPIRPLAWEPPYAVRVAQEMTKKKKLKCVNPNIWGGVGFGGAKPDFSSDSV